jgi:hypothetical protein
MTGQGIWLGKAYDWARHMAKQGMWPGKACGQARHVASEILGVLKGICIICLGGMSPLSPCAISTDSLAKDRSLQS